MSEAEKKNSTRSAGPVPHDVGPHDGMSQTVARLRQIAQESADTLLLANGPPHPDHKLLHECSEAVRLLTEARRLWEWDQEESFAEARANVPFDDRLERDKQRRAIQDRVQRQANGQMRRAAKLRATTPAGIFAKALVVRATSTGAAVFGKGLAEDLLANDTLRRSIWPAGA